MKDSEIVKNIINFITGEAERFEELRYLFCKYESELREEKWQEEREKNVQ